MAPQHLPTQNNAPVLRVYADPKPVRLDKKKVTAGEVSEYKGHKIPTVEPIPPPRPGAALVVQLENVLGQQAVDQITQNKQIVFHSVGDTGADKRQRVPFEDSVVNSMVKDLADANSAEAPSFFYHLGDVVYEFGQADSYYAQFYEPYAMYNAPIFAIPGNHDGMIWDQSMKSLDAFLNNFCAQTPGVAENAAGLSRTTMDLPGVYFTLEAPFVNIIGIYSNVVDLGFGIISSENGTYPSVTDAQKDFLISELQRLAPIRNNNQTAVIVALHHPPYKGNDEAVNTLGKDLDDAFTKAGFWPDLVLSGHEHLYERFERDTNGVQLPYIVAGSGGYNIKAQIPSDPTTKVPAGISANNPAVKAYAVAFGYLKIKVSQDKLAVVFNSIDKSYGNAFDAIVIDLKTHAVTENAIGVEPVII